MMLVGANASADDSYPQASPPFGSAPRPGDAGVSLTTMAAEAESGGGLKGGAIVGASIGLPYSTGLRVALPLLFGDHLEAGSPAAALVLSGFLRPSTTLKVEMRGEIGVRAPSLGASDVVLGEEQIAYSGWGLQSGIIFNLVHESGLLLTSWYKDEPTFSRLSAGLGYRVLAAGQVTVGVGLASSFDSARVPSKILAHLAYRPRWLADASASLFGSYTLDRNDSALAGAGGASIGLGLTWELALSGDRTSPGPSLLHTRSSERLDNLRPLEIDDAPVALSEFAIPNTVTIFTFEASWCGPCRDVHRDLEKLASTRPDLQIRTIDADAKRRVFKANGGSGLPFVFVFGRDGREVGRVLGYRPRVIDELISEASK